MAITRGTTAGTDYVVVANSTASTTTVFTKPSGLVDGDVLVVEVDQSTTAATVTAPSGWTVVPGPTWPVLLTSGKQTRGFYRVVTSAAGEPASYTWTWSGTAAKNGGTMVRYTGVDNTTPSDVNGVAGTEATQTVALPSITTVTAGAWLLSVAIGDADTSATFSSTPAGMTLVAQHAGTRGGIADETRATAGATGTRSWTISTSTLTVNGWQWALRPAATVAASSQPHTRLVRQAVSRSAVF